MGAVLRARLNGRDYEFDGTSEVRIGRDPAAELLSSNPIVSREHAVLRPVENGWVLEDRMSRGGTYVNGQPVRQLEVTGALTVRLGDPQQGDELQLVPERPAPPPRPATIGPQATMAPPPAGPAQTEVRLGRRTGVYRTDSAKVRIGRAPDNDVVVDDMQVSRYHAELVLTPSANYELVDLGSHNGTFVDGHQITRAPITESSIIGLGRHQFRLVQGALELYEDTGHVEFEASRLGVTTNEGKSILDDVSFALPENCFLAVVGPSGAGKSTLMKALTGFSPADQGTVLYNGRDLYDSIDELKSRIGYVPQDDILHPQLTVRRALDFSAELRFPADVSKAERAKAVEDVMEELGLSHRADLQISKLSGGQRKRVSVALELITKPSLLFLDEPTSGLDPGFEKSAMELMRSLADGGRTVIVVTHSLQSLNLCDRVIFLAPGGSTAFFGPPDEALQYFGGDDYADVFRALEQPSEPTWKVKFEGSRPYDSYVRMPAERAQLQRADAEPAGSRPAQRSWFGQLSVMVRRQLAIIAADRGLMAMLVLLAPVMGIALIGVLGSAGLTPAFATVHGKRQVVPNINSLNVLFGLIFCMGLIGTVDSFREIVKELPIVRRERSIGLSLSAYVTSKLVVLVPFVIVQASILTLLGVARQHGPNTSNVLHPAVFEMLFDVALSGIAAMCVGLLISAAVTTSDKVTPLMAGVIALQLLLGGALFDIRDKPGIVQLSNLATTRWGFDIVSSSVDAAKLEVGQCHAPPKVGCDGNWIHSKSIWLKDAGALATISVVSVGGTAYMLKRRDPKPKRRKQTVR